ncbi:hypothetical protein SKAU_G00110580 [Synaphobranchus kaupii]|uniref:Uncharacterized protein n=1 Tax=Synaphobranchus kaupii TaxID=118154 RepID=A0A9Q1G0B8_SYNKA|nr:hypothetical protein SKAU_G00110580 [Synaphobranchus kaupii]
MPPPPNPRPRWPGALTAPLHRAFVSAVAKETGPPTGDVPVAEATAAAGLICSPDAGHADLLDEQPASRAKPYGVGIGGMGGGGWSCCGGPGGQMRIVPGPSLHRG